MPIVAKTIAEATAAMGDPKANFLAWYRHVRESSEVHFDLPAALNVALENLPAETFAVTAPPLKCKLRMSKELPENLRKPWQSGLPDYETLTAEAQRRLTAYGADDALRGLSSLVEERPGDAALARDLAFSAIEWQRPGEAYHLLRRVGAARTFEPITFHAMAHCLEQMGRPTWRSFTMNWPAAGSGTTASATCTTSPNWTICVSCGGWPTAATRTKAVPPG